MRDARTRAGFPDTRWSLLGAAGAPDGGHALEEICRAYWYPLYAFARRSGSGPADAEDLTQEFFRKLLEKNWLVDAEREKGRLRTFFLTAFRRHMANEWRHRLAERRGGGAEPLAWEMPGGEERYSLAGPGMAPEELFDRQWALALMARALDGLEREYLAAGNGGDYQVLKDALMLDHGAIDYETVTARLGTTEGAARVAVHRIRKRFRTRFRAEVALTLEDNKDLDDELRYIARMLSA
jgi:RNA polymerase sigma-70 factor (ECF subfamily)